MTLTVTEFEHLTEPLISGCPVCRASAGPERLFQKSSVWIEECGVCRHRFARPDNEDQHVATVYGDDYFFGGGAGYDDYLSESQLLTAHGRRYGRLLKRFLKPGRMLDVGAAAGFVLKGFCEEGWQGRGVEPNARVARYAREQLGVDVATAAFERFADDCTERFDLVSMIQVMGHFIDPNEAIDAVSRLTTEDGFCLIETWNVRSWSARFFGANWHEYSPPSVLHWFSPQTLRRLMQRHGFEQVTLGRPQKWLNAGHAKSLLGHKAESSLLAKGVRLALRCLPDRVNLPYPSEDLFWGLYRKADG